MTTMNAVNVHDDDEQDLAPIKAWRNLLFMKDGRSVFGAHTHLTEEKARNAAELGEIALAAFIARHGDVQIMKGRSTVRLYLASEYSHAIQMPITV